MVVIGASLLSYLNLIYSIQFDLVRLWWEWLQWKHHYHHCNLMYTWQNCCQRYNLTGLSYCGVLLVIQRSGGGCNLCEDDDDSSNVVVITVISIEFMLGKFVIKMLELNTRLLWGYCWWLQATQWIWMNLGAAHTEKIESVLTRMTDTVTTQHASEANATMRYWPIK